MASLEYHAQREDLAIWARTSLGDERLEKEIKKLKNTKGEALREGLIQAVSSSLQECRR
jgi:hypothetical protein